MARRDINKKAIPFILVNGMAFLLMLVLGKTTPTGLWTFTNLFYLALILTMATFCFFSVRESVNTTVEFYRKKKYGIAIGQMAISVFILFIACSFIWVFIGAITKNF